MPDVTNDNYLPRATGPQPDPHGQAAMLLVESLIHGLVERRVLTTGDAIEIVGTAAEVKTEIGEDLGDAPATMAKSLDLLAAISSSLAHDV